MALSRRTGARFQNSIWPGFVDAMTALLLVLIFVLTIFMVLQSIQTETITGQETELDRLSADLASISAALGAERVRSADLEDRLADLGLTLDAAETEAEFQARLVEALTTQAEARIAELGAARTRITDFEAQVAALLADRDAARAQVADLTETRATLDQALAASRAQVDAEQEAARLAAARREALEALVADLRMREAEQGEALSGAEADLASAREALSEEEAARLAEAAAAEALRARLQDADAELTAMTLALEDQRRRAEETLTLLAAAEEAEADLDERLMAALLEGQEAAAALRASEASGEDVASRLAAALEAQARGAEARAAAEDRAADALAAAEAEAETLRDQLAAALAAKVAAENARETALTEAEERAALLSAARAEVADVEAAGAADRRRLAALNAQVGRLNDQLAQLQGLLDDAETRDAQAEVRITSLGSQLNTALARVAAEERKRADLEEAERRRLEEEAQQLERYRSEFFGRLREVIGGQDGVEIVGDRFIFSSEVLFGIGSAQLSAEGRAEIAKVARLLQEVAAVIPPEINWVVRVDGHTDDRPLSGFGAFADNWELSQARALSVVRYMIDAYGFPADRLAATGFAEFQPLDPSDTPEARALNRRIELKLTER